MRIGFVITLIGMLLISSCSGIKLLNDKKFYSDKFLKQLSSIQLIYRDGDKQLALKKLDAIDDQTLTRDEKAKKYNFKGVLLFSLSDINGAIESFEKANVFVESDLYLKSDIRLNLASSYFKLQKLELTSQYLNDIDPNYLKGKEKENYFRLMFTIANQNDDHAVVVRSLLNLMGDVKTFEGFDNFKFKEILIDNFKKLGDSIRVDILYNNADDHRIVIAYLARIEAMNRFFLGEREAASDVVSWMESKFGDLPDVMSFVSDFKFRAENFSKINSGAIGVVAPLSGKFSKYGEKVVAGVNTALSASKHKSLVQVHVKDNQNNAYLAKNRIQELVLKHHVSVIIGGLFPGLAKEEYLEARKYGVFYISLSPVYLPRSQKNQLLLEVQGSVESQISSVMRPSVLNTFGNRVAILYPESDAGRTFMDELWSQHNISKINITNAYSFEQGIEDYREHVKGVLGLKFPREREEEYKIWKEIKSESKSSVRIINVLPPIQDFDWVFLPTLPNEAIQILPTFSFFDAKNIKFIGGPSWINKKLQRERRNLGGQLYLIGNDTNQVKEDFISLYKSKNNMFPQLVDTISFEGMNLALRVLGEKNFEKREDMAKHITELNQLEGMTSNWKLQDNIWIKDMDLIKIGNKGFSKVEI